MSAATVRSEDVMTDFQFKALIKMVLSILDSNSNEDAKKILKDLVGVKTGAKDTIDDE
ncbi:hypothetical protein FACS1894187_06240 [Synergistales bacterium]|nr:hypothetical protein FACS1894187_06240 [Synergistales bacterium]